MADNKKRVIGVTGGIGSGKSEVVKILRNDYGAHVILTDDVAKALEEPGQEAYKDIVLMFGEEILNPDGTINRLALSEKIFSDPKMLGIINDLVHPLVYMRIKQEAADCGADLVVVESALFLENAYKIWDELWYVHSSEEVRVNRLMSMRGYPRERAMSIIRSQPSEEAFTQAADHVLYNEGDLDDLKGRIHALLDGGT
ncbi:MAG: dephospho-CoA kinase [Lachnospiraceae bacterium]|jgi:dephospho-CoA kinase|nr:dephospho-CoA kinase [Lachnospiraceae bacterium]